MTNRFTQENSVLLLPTRFTNLLPSCACACSSSSCSCALLKHLFRLFITKFNTIKYTSYFHNQIVTLILVPKDETVGGAMGVPGIAGAAVVAAGTAAVAADDGSPAAAEMREMVAEIAVAVFAVVMVPGVAVVAAAVVVEVVAVVAAPDAAAPVPEVVGPPVAEKLFHPLVVH